VSDEFIERLKENERVLGTLDDEKIGFLALSELMAEMAVGKEVPPGSKAKRIVLSAELAKRAGVKW